MLMKESNTGKEAAMTSNHFENGTAVVTGAGSGLGAAMVDRFTSQGMSIVALDIDGERAEQKAAAVRAGGGQARSMRVDVADRSALDAAARLANDAFGGCTVLCANVGMQQFGAIERLTEQDWRWVLDVNVMGVVNTDVAANERYIITHGQYRDGIQERFDDLLRAYDHAQSG
jgi:NAD(P)-dependent dehydrogenase (short-subunit alcohol dehydrogenase family)